MNKDQIKKLIAHIEKLRDFERGQNKKQKTTREVLDEEANEKGFLDAARELLAARGPGAAETEAN